MTQPIASTPTPADMARVRAWTAEMFDQPENLPVSFTYAGAPVRGIPASWNPTITRRIVDANIIETSYEGVDPRTGLRVSVEATFYRDYPVVEWVVWLANDGSADTPVISNLLALDRLFTGEIPIVYHCNGDFYNIDGYKPEETPIGIGETLRFAPNGGRPCDGAFPYYRIAFAGGGLAIAVGWPAQWAVRFDGAAWGVRVQAGQELTHLRLHRGERIRTPRMTVLAWDGDSRRAVNLWRRWYLAHILPRPNGAPMKPHLACAATDEGEEFTAATEENQIRYLTKIRGLGIKPDVWWIDAGWYPCYNEEGARRWPMTGTWEPDPERFPRGLRPVSDVAARGGTDLLMWFEPERIAPGTILDNSRPEWVHRIAGNRWALLALSNPETRAWLTDHVCRLIQDNGIRIYRQDFNFEPLAYWRQADADDRQGMTENLHVQGYLQYWDDLLARNPGLWIDSCSSGGRRNDLETMRRSVPLHYTDYGYGDHPVKLAFHRTLFEWIPYFKECTLSWDLAGGARFDHVIDSYSFHCGMAAMLFPTFDARRDDYDWALAAKMIGVWRKIADLLLNGDYYPHTPFHRSADGWVAWQFDRPESGRGFIQAIRLPQNTDDALTVYPQGICAEGRYVFENPETGETRAIAGAELIESGFTFRLPPRAGQIWLYSWE